MAGPLTWREVTAPNFSNVAESQRAAALALNGGFEAIGNALANARTRRQQAANSTFLSSIAGFGNTAALDAGIGQLNTSGVSPEALKFAAAQRSTLLDDDNQRLANEQFGWANATKRAQEAARPEAVQLLADIRTTAQIGTPEARQKAMEMARAGANVLSATGVDLDGMAALINGNMDTTRAGMNLNQDLQATGDANKERAVRLAADELFKSAAARNGDVAAAERDLRSRPGVDPNVVDQALQQLTAKGPNIFGGNVDPNDVVLDQALGQNGGIAPLINLVDRTEGGGQWNTLYGHAQRNGGAFEGVDVSKMTIGQLKDFASSDGAYGKHQKATLGYLATPMGRFQVVGSTLNKAAKEMGLSDDTVFDERTQSAIFQHLVNGRLSGPRTMAGKISGLRQEWEGFKNVSDKQLEAAITAYESGDTSALFNMGGVGGGAAPSGSAGFNPASAMIAGAVGTDQNLLTRNTELVSQSQDILDRANLDNALFGDNLLASLTSNEKKSETEITNELLTNAGGEDIGLPKSEVIDQLNRVRKKYPGMPADVAGALMLEAREQGLWGTRWLMGEVQFDHEAIDRLVERIWDPNAKTPGEKIQRAIEITQAERAKRDAAALLQQAASRVEKAQQEYFNARRAQMDGKNVNVDKARKKYEAVLELFQGQINKADGDERLTANTRASLGGEARELEKAIMARRSSTMGIPMGR